MKIIITAGGTMGHINPALAIIKEFERQDKNLEVLYIGTHNRMEKDLIPSLGYKYEELKIYGLGKNLWLDVKNLFYIKKAIKKCKQIMFDFKPDIVIGVGGYVTFPVVYAAHELGIKIFLHEQNSLPGKSNLLTAKYASLIGVTFEKSKDVIKTKGKVIYTGHPCGAMALDIPKKSKEEFGFNKGKKLVTVVAGSLGSGSLNEKFKEYLKNISDKNYEVCYITGKMHYENFTKDAIFPSNVKVLPYVNELPGLLKISDLVISRAGAGSLSEILALELPSLIIPSPNVANNHQFHNAKELADKGCICLLEEKDVTTNLLEEKIDNLLKDTTLRLKMRNKMHELDTKDSSKIIYDAIKELVK